MKGFGAAVKVAALLPEGFELKASYPVVCTKCGATWTISPGLAFHFGLNSGHWTCHTRECRTFHHVELDVELNEMLSVPWSTYAAGVAMLGGA